MKALIGVLGVISMPLMVLNTFGGIVSGIWLAVLGQWGTIGIGIVVFLLGSVVASFLLMPSMAMAGIGATAMSRGQNFFGWIFIILGAILTIFAIIIFEYEIFHIFGQKAASSGAVFPTWLWSYGVATGVWSYMASQERGELDASTFYVFAAQVAYIVLSVCRVWLNWSLEDSVIAMALPLGLPLVMGTALAITISKQTNAPLV